MLNKLGAPHIFKSKTV